METWSDVLSGTAVIPVLVIERLEDALPLATTLVGAGLTVLEVTLRTPVARDAIKAMQEGAPDAVVGVGTVLDAEAFHDMAALGVRFAVSPGHTPGLLDAAKETGVPYLPGAQTVSEVLSLREQGFLMQKFFPAQSSGGVAMLKTLSVVAPDVRFCPTGGVNADNAKSYLDLPNVACIGGSWIAPADLVQAGQWGEIAARAKAAAGLVCAEG